MINDETIFECSTVSIEPKMYCIKIYNYTFNVNEFSCVEILVSIIRAIDNSILIMNHNTIEKNCIVMHKQEYGLSVVLHKNHICIHLYGKFIIESTSNNLIQLSESIYSFLNIEYGKGIINLKTFDPSFLEHMLGVDLPFLESASFENRYLLELELYNRKNPDIRMRADNHEYIEILKSGIVNKKNLIDDYKFQYFSEEERLKSIFQKFLEGYTSEYYAIIYNDEMFVRDGTHRIVCMYYMFGNIEIPVLRLRFSKTFFSYSLYKNNKAGDKPYGSNKKRI